MRLYPVDGRGAQFWQVAADRRHNPSLYGSTFRVRLEILYGLISSSVSRHQADSRGRSSRRRGGGRRASLRTPKPPFCLEEHPNCKVAEIQGIPETGERPRSGLGQSSGRGIKSKCRGERDLGEDAWRCCNIHRVWMEEFSDRGPRGN